MSKRKRKNEISSSKEFLKVNKETNFIEVPNHSKTGFISGFGVLDGKLYAEIVDFNEKIGYTDDEIEDEFQDDIDTRDLVDIFKDNNGKR